MHFLLGILNLSDCRLLILREQIPVQSCTKLLFLIVHSIDSGRVQYTTGCRVQYSRLVCSCNELKEGQAFGNKSEGT